LQKTLWAQPRHPARRRAFGAAEIGVLRLGNDVYQLKNQAGVEDFAGRKVQITGTLDTKTNAIENTHVEVIRSKGAAS